MMNLSNSFEFTCPTKTNSGNKALENIPVELESLDARKPLVITGTDIVDQQLIDIFLGAFGNSGMTLGIFDSIGKNADSSMIEQLKKAYLDEKFDSIIALGGGPIMDAAKSLNIMVSLPTADLRNSSATSLIQKPLRPLVYVPADTATGLETSKFASINGATLSSHYFMPNLVIIDPRMTRVKNGKAVFANTLAAFCRALEAYTGQDKNPLTDSYAFAAIQFICENFLTLLATPGDSKAGLAIANAMAMSGCAFSNVEAGMLHRIAQALPARINAQSGIVMSVCLPHVFAYCGKKSGYFIAEALLPLAGHDEYAAVPAKQRLDKTLKFIGQFLTELSVKGPERIPASLTEAGIESSMIDDILSNLKLDQDTQMNADDFRAVLESACEGRPVA
jgi:alcohol dehydrogenase